MRKQDLTNGNDWDIYKDNGNDNEAIVQFTVWDSETPETPETPKTPRLPRLRDSRDSETPEAFVILLFNFPLFQIYNKTPRLPKLN